MSIPDQINRLLQLGSDEDVSLDKAELLELASGVTIRDLNRVIVILGHRASVCRRQASALYTDVGILSDEVRRRAEAFETITF